MNLEITVDGRPVSIDAVANGNLYEIAPGLYSIVYQGRTYEVFIAKLGDQWTAAVGDRTYVVEIQNPRDAAKRSDAALGHMHQDVKAPMPGKVIRVLVREGDDIKAGQGVAVVEAMKMQNELKALRSGRVVRVAVQDGDTVVAGDTLVTLD